VDDPSDKIHEANLRRTHRTQFDAACASVREFPRELEWMGLSATTIDIRLDGITKKPLSGERTKEALEAIEYLNGLEFTAFKEFWAYEEKWKSSVGDAKMAIQLRLNICSKFIEHLFRKWGTVCDILIVEFERLQMDTGPLLRKKQHLQLCLSNQLMDSGLKYGTPTNEISRHYREAIQPYLHDGLDPDVAFDEAVAALRRRFDTEMTANSTPVAGTEADTPNSAGHPASKTPDSATQKIDVELFPTKRLRMPSKQAFAAWYLHSIGKKQVEIAELMQKKLGRLVNQGQVSKWINQVTRYLGDGNPLPQLSEISEISIDPSQLDMGRRTDGRTGRQRDKSSD
jgi:hypothetical protein